MEKTKVLLDASTIERTIRRLVYEVIEKNRDLSKIVILGIPTRGFTLGKRIISNIKSIEGVDVSFGKLNVSAYRDDEKRTEKKELPKIDVNQKTVILVDDVLFTGRTIRAAMDAVIDLGRPSSIQVLVLIDRGHREFPVSANYIGKNIPTALSEKITVRFIEDDATEEVVLG